MSPFDPLQDPVTRDDWYDTEPGLFDLADHHYDIAKDQGHQ
ncbi:hypothetical protein ACIQYW_13990 [Rhodococcus erythropolis]